MFQDIEKKIKTVAKIVFWIGMLLTGGSLIEQLIRYLNYRENLLVYLIISLLLCVAIFVLSKQVFGFLESNFDQYIQIVIYVLLGLLLLNVILHVFAGWHFWGFCFVSLIFSILYNNRLVKINQENKPVMLVIVGSVCAFVLHLLIVFLQNTYLALPLLIMLAEMLGVWMITVLFYGFGDLIGNVKKAKENNRIINEMLNDANGL